MIDLPDPMLAACDKFGETVRHGRDTTVRLRQLP